jgi:uncharacterized protein
MTWIARILRAFVRGYQLLARPLVPAACRYEPSCSHYALDALGRHGAIAGSWLAVKRVLRCHPWSEGGYDPVPEPAPAYQCMARCHTVLKPRPAPRPGPDRAPRAASPRHGAAFSRGAIFR